MQNRNHICNCCAGYDEKNIRAILPLLPHIIEDLNLKEWFLNFSCISVCDTWDNKETDIGKFFADKRIGLQTFNGSNLKCVVLKLQSYYLSVNYIN